LRFSTRVADSEGKPRGIVVLTYDANILLELAQPPVAAAEIYVTNDKGFFLKSVNDSDEFSFMFPDAPQSSFGQRYPAAWGAISLATEGRIDARDGLFFFSTLNSRQEGGTELAFQRHKTVDAEKWKLIIRIPPAYFAAQRKQAIEWLLYFNLIGLAAITPLLYYYARLRTNQAENQRQIERMKDEFVSVVSHELRTPLTSIRGALGLLNTDPVRNDPHKSRRMAELALSNTDRLVHLINNILDMEKIRAGSLPLDIRDCNSRQLLVTSSEMMRGMAEKHQVVLHVQGDGHDVPADAFRFGQVLNNLVGNAIKYSPEASVVEMWSEARNGEIVFGVRDKGRGIPSDKKDAIFGRFQQVDASDSRAMGGSGLGLAISRSIVLQHRGRIWVESEPEQGSTFYVALPRS
jgi:signal transduction histidine kinase